MAKPNAHILDALRFLEETVQQVKGSSHTVLAVVIVNVTTGRLDLIAHAARLKDPEAFMKRFDAALDLTMQHPGALS